ncbi:MAG: polysaccharide deacetylase family sporulation protein PdaB [Firmicutes bacterium]|nr:polysaccharide deacetylase family sporulation protein PdaB [Bacillota bacterium]
MREAKALYALFLMVIIVTASLHQYSLDLAVNGAIDRPIYLIPTSEPAVALTFDISWGEKSPGPILDILKEKQVTATFFLSGPWVESHPELAKRIADEGHEIASHGHRHINYSPLSRAEIISEVTASKEAIKRVTGVDIEFIRTPNGDYDAEAISAIREAGLTAIHWSVDSKDWLNPGVDQIVKNVLTEARQGSIILMHASDSCQQTAQALPQVIEGLRRKGLAIKTVGELYTLYRNRKPPLAR